MERPYSRGRIVARSALALLAGIVVAVCLVSLYGFVDILLDRGLSYREEDYFFSTQDWVRAYATVAAMVAPFLALVCVPIWMLLVRFKLDRWYAAALLGFAVPLTFWVVQGSDTTSLVGLLRDGSAYGLCGAVAGLAVWWIGPRQTARLLHAEPNRG